MPGPREPSYADLVHEVLRESPEPMPFSAILERVSQRREVETRDPKATIRGAITQSHLLVSLGHSLYGYVPRLVTGSLLRIPLAGKRPANNPLVLPDEFIHALWPDFFEPEKRKLDRRVTVRLPNGAEATLVLAFLAPSVWGCPMTESLHAYLVERRASAGDSLLVRIVDGDRGSCEGWLESQLKRDKAAIRRRNEELANAAAQILERKNPNEAMIWELATALLVRGLYRADPAPDSLESVLGSDRRFVFAGLRYWALAESLTPDDRILIKDRIKTTADLLTPRPPGFPGLELPSDPLSARRAMERALSDVSALLAAEGIGSPDEADALLRSALAQGRLPRRVAVKPLEQAQSLMYDAWEAGSSRERVRLARKALELSPDCADAYVLLAEETGRTIGEASDIYEKGVAAGERALGAEFFKAEAGHFWGLIETRPYMRARLGFAQSLWQQGKRREGIDHLWEMLDLNPGDNQGCRYLLLSWLLETGDDAACARLLGLYRDDGAAAWAFGGALHAFRTEGDSPRARELAGIANKANHHVAAYLLGRKRLPRTMPVTVGIGDESEGVDCAAGQLPAWKSAPGAIQWLDRLTKRG